MEPESSLRAGTLQSPSPAPGVGPGRGLPTLRPRELAGRQPEFILWMGPHTGPTRVSAGPPQGPVPPFTGASLPCIMRRQDGACGTLSASQPPRAGSRPPPGQQRGPVPQGLKTRPRVGRTEARWEQESPLPEASVWAGGAARSLSHSCRNVAQLVSSQRGCQPQGAQR